MFRYRDEHGDLQTLVGREALGVAIAAGRVGPDTPLAEDDGHWAPARLNPAYRALAAAPREPPPRPSLWKLRGVALAKDPRGLALIAVVSIAVTWSIGRVERTASDSAEREALARAFAAAQSGGSAEALGQPPDSPRLRPLWAVMAGLRDVRAELDRRGQELGYDARLPPGWGAPDHTLHPSRHPEMLAWLDAALRYQGFAKGVAALTETAIRSRAAQAGLAPDDVEALMETMRPALLLAGERQRRAEDAAIHLRYLHRIFLVNEGAVRIGPRNEPTFTESAARVDYDRTLANLESAQADMARLEAEQRAATRTALATLGG